MEHALTPQSAAGLPPELRLIAPAGAIDPRPAVPNQTAAPLEVTTSPTEAVADTECREAEKQQLDSIPNPHQPTSYSLWTMVVSLLLLLTEVVSRWCSAFTTNIERIYQKVCDDLVALKPSNEKLVSKLRKEVEVAQRARQKAEAEARSKSRFLAAASHDLRQPLHAMSLYTEALRRRIPTGPTGELVDSIRASVEALEDQFSALLDIAKLDAGAIQSVPQHFAIGDLFQRLEVHVRPLAFEKGLDLKFRGAHHIVHADPNLLERVLRNLVSNAIRYTEEGGVLVSCRRRGAKLLLQVWDSGIGIAQANVRHIFEEYYQVPSLKGMTSPPHSGMGLGLSIVRRIVDQMNLPLNLRSRVGHGSVFGLQMSAGQAGLVKKRGSQEIFAQVRSARELRRPAQSSRLSMSRVVPIRAAASTTRGSPAANCSELGGCKSLRRRIAT